MTESDRLHPVLPDAWRYQIIGVCLDLVPESGEEPFLDLTLLRGDERRWLRFHSPQDVELERGGPASGGLTILDVTSHGLEGIGVRVENREGNTGSLTFWARSVVDLAPGRARRC